MLQAIISWAKFAEFASNSIGSKSSTEKECLRQRKMEKVALHAKAALRLFPVIVVGVLRALHRNGAGENDSASSRKK